MSRQVKWGPPHCRLVSAAAFTNFNNVLNIGTSTIAGGTFNGNTVSGGGGGGAMYTRAQTTTIYSTVISNNSVTSTNSSTAPGAEGAAIYASSAAGSTLNLINSTIAGNTGYNAAIVGFGTAITTITGCTITGNTGVSRAGAIYGQRPLVINTSTISANSNAGGLGGAIWTFSSLSISGSTIANNIAAEGGAIYFADQLNGLAPLSITNSTFSSNTASGYPGGAIYDAVVYGVSISGSTCLG